jgi:hypothetical protein
MGLTYCCCTAGSSLCQSCFGSTAEGTTGRKRSVLLLALTILLALWFQYSVGPAIVSNNNSGDSDSDSAGWFLTIFRWIPGLGSTVRSAWYDPCIAYKDDEPLLAQCAGNAGVYRPCAVATLFYLLSAVATKVQPRLNREAWPAKYALFGISVFATLFLSSAVTFDGVYLWFARAGATLFLLLQQVILIDVAYNWNEDWVDRSDQADRLEYGSGSVWLQAIVATCVAFYIFTLTGIGLLYEYFGGCSENTWIITLTLLGVGALTAIQLSGSEGSLLTSSVVSLYAVYLAYSMVSKNPNQQCNPQLGGNDFWGIAIGLTLTALSLAWTGWSWTAEERLNAQGVQSAKPMAPSSSSSHNNNGNNGGNGGQGGANLDVPFLDPDDQPTSGMVMESDQVMSSSSPMFGRDIWKLNIVMALISCFVAMTLTGFGSMETELDEHENAANPTVGRFNMATIGISQWLAILLYVWTLLAPRIYPDYDFS